MQRPLIYMFGLWSPNKHRRRRKENKDIPERDSSDKNLQQSCKFFTHWDQSCKLVNDLFWLTLF